MKLFYRGTTLFTFFLLLVTSACQEKSKGELGSELIEAVREGKASQVRSLIEAGASLSVRDENGEILWRVALEHYNKRTWEVLTENHIDLSEPDSGASYAIHVAAANGLSDAAERILKLDAGKVRLNANGDTP
ncbi:MAG TPA: hypothetical protein PLY93_04305, partial [Turneriella sp.]|nr:hypothetical protein [Turneriella sp.]